MVDSPTLFSRALVQAQHAIAKGEVPVGAVIVDSTGTVLAAAHNLVETTHDATAHAEILAIRAASAVRQNFRLDDCDLYVTLEPCAMCAQAIAFARVRRVYFGAYDPKGGGVDHGPRIFQQPTCHHTPEVYGGIEAEACGKILQKFFKQQRTTA